MDKAEECINDMERHVSTIPSKCNPSDHSEIMGFPWLKINEPILLELGYCGIDK